ncbi:putative 3TM holin [Enterobacter sp. BIGb0383]|uniref:phage holin family protein n=1 Tax=unclassified Enterobacter TaxID=2608935 RepID=UPI000F46CDDD|nr:MULTISPECIES: phage holin family protein [unclassified Enterobacter]ROP56296.1 putative 3TM holin [Enterobacter sp. BIGb0383]ROS06035.1 putative 3TM holin [Enterobacter sp. BIGb0359]
MLQEIFLNLNAIICAAAAIRLVTFRRNHTGHNRQIAWLAWLLTVATGSVPIRVLTGEYFYTDWTDVFINLLLCIMIFRARGNVAHLLKGKSDDYQQGEARPN